MRMTRFMRLILMFDLPIETKAEQRRMKDLYEYSILFIQSYA